MVGTGQNIGRFFNFPLFVCFIAFVVTICDANAEDGLTNRTGTLAYSNGRDIKLNFRQLFNRKSIFRDVHFQYYDRRGKSKIVKNLQREPNFEESGCDPAGKFAIIVHGWNETCDTREWIDDVISNLTRYRGGCIICMDYRAYSLQEYGQLVLNYPAVSRALTIKLDHLVKAGFDPDKGFMYGFSFGAHIVLRASRRFGHQRLAEVDVCEPAGPWFDRNQAVDYRNAAKNVQCIHTSTYPGTEYQGGCHQNWRMGDCGITQPGAKEAPCGGHGLCPYFYNSAFSNDFVAVKKPSNCLAENEAESWPENFKMGYNEPRKRKVRGQLFALTSYAHPWNIRVRQLL